MKKILAVLALGLVTSAFAANFVQLEQEVVQARQNGDADSKVTYLRAGKDIGDYSLGLQSRTARFSTNSIANSLEATVANKNVSAFGVTPFVGIGHDFGATNSGYNYGLVGATSGAKIGPGFALVGLKTRVDTNANDPKQTVAWASYAYPVAKNVDFTVGVSRSGQDIKERGVSAGLSFGF